jgi:hypothetical protein
MTNGHGLPPFLFRPGWCCIPLEGTNPIGFGLQEMPKASPRIAELSKVVGSPKETAMAAFRHGSMKRWLRGLEAWDGFTKVLMARLHYADPANGCGIGGAPSRCRDPVGAAVY